MKYRQEMKRAQFKALQEITAADDELGVD